MKALFAYPRLAGLLLLAIFLFPTSACKQTAQHSTQVDAAFGQTYYLITLGKDIPHGSDILDKPCSVVFSYPGGSHSPVFSGTIIAWRTQNSVLMASNYMNIEAAWVGANGGTLSIFVNPSSTLTYPITNFQKENSAPELAPQLISFESVNHYVKNTLPGELSNFFLTWDQRKGVNQYYRSETKWYYEGTVQFEIAARIQSFIGAEIGNWLVLREQPYPQNPKEIIDVYVIAPDGSSIAIEVKSDFILEQARSDYEKLRINGNDFDYGYVFFCADQDRVAAWIQQIQQQNVTNVFARGIARSTGN